MTAITVYVALVLALFAACVRYRVRLRRSLRRSLTARRRTAREEWERRCRARERSAA